MKWFLAGLALLIVLWVSGALSSLVNKKLEDRAAAGRRAFCARMSVGNVTGALEGMPRDPTIMTALSKSGRIAQCGDQGLPVPVETFPKGMCPQVKQTLHIKWESGEAVTLDIVYSCIPLLNLAYTDVDRVLVETR